MITVTSTCVLVVHSKSDLKKNLNQKKIVLSSEEMESVYCQAVSPIQKLFFEAICDPS